MVTQFCYIFHHVLDEIIWVVVVIVYDAIAFENNVLEYISQLAGEGGKWVILHSYHRRAKRSEPSTLGTEYIITIPVTFNICVCKFCNTTALRTFQDVSCKL